MLRRLRRRWRRIRYYSADRRRSPWQRAFDVGIVAGLVLAVPATFAAEALVVRTVNRSVTSGRLYGPPGGPVVATVAGADGSLPPSGGLPSYGEWSLALDDRTRGWPLTTMRAPAPPRLDLNLFHEPGARSGARLATNDPVRIAIESALLEAGAPASLGRAPGGRAEADRAWLDTIAGVALWWVLLTIATGAVLLLARAAAIVGVTQRADRVAGRLAEGRCTKCNYDLRGLEYNERCPECGALIEWRA